MVQVSPRQMFHETLPQNKNKNKKNHKKGLVEWLKQ
jgi:hypothetical protein